MASNTYLSRQQIKDLLPGLFDNGTFLEGIGLPSGQEKYPNGGING